MNIRKHRWPPPNNKKCGCAEYLCPVHGDIYATVAPRVICGYSSCCCASLSIKYICPGFSTFICDKCSKACDGFGLKIKMAKVTKRDERSINENIDSNRVPPSPPPMRIVYKNDGYYSALHIAILIFFILNFFHFISLINHS